MDNFRAVTVEDFEEMIDAAGKPVNTKDFESDIPTFRISDYVKTDLTKKQDRLFYKEGKILYILNDSKMVQTRLPGYGPCKSIDLGFSGQGVSPTGELTTCDFVKRLYLVEDRIDTAIDFAAALGGFDPENFDHSLINFVDYIGATGVGEWRYFYDSNGKAKCGYLSAILSSSKATKLQG